MNGLRVSSGVGGLGPGPVPTVGEPRGTVLYDAIYLAADEKLRSEVGRKVIVVITDGVDEGSQLTIKQAIEAAQKADAVIYSIDYSDPAPTAGSAGRRRRRRRALPAQDVRRDRRPRLQGGPQAPLDEVFKELQDEMRSQYSIGYTPDQRRQGRLLPQLDIKLANKDLKAQARKGYYAIKPETS